MNIVFTETAWEQYIHWQTEDKKMIKRINQLIKSIQRDGLLLSLIHIWTGIPRKASQTAVPSAATGN